jgi:general secretion pathway protein D
MNNYRAFVFSFLLVFGAGCETTGPVINVPVSPLASGEPEQSKVEEIPGPETDSASEESPGEDVTGVTRLTPLARTSAAVQREDLSDRFSDQDELRVAVEDMPLSRFIHYVFGDLLQVNYVISEGMDVLQDGGGADAGVTQGPLIGRSPAEIQEQLRRQAQNRAVAGQQPSNGGQEFDRPVNVNIQEPISSRRLYQIATRLLGERNIRVTYRDGVFYLHPSGRRSPGGAFIGLGARAEDVPEGPGLILQVIPVQYGVTPSVERTIRELVDAKVVGDPAQGALFVTGERFEILRALDVVRLLDQPAQRGRHVGLVSLTYLTVDDFIEKVAELLMAEGVPVDIGGAGGSASVALVSLESIGAVAIFSKSARLIDRVDFWTRQLDRPMQGAERQYFIYTPRFARADELGQSLVPLLGDVDTTDASAESQPRDTRSAMAADMARSAVDSALQPRRESSGSRSQAAAARPTVAVRTEDLTMSVDPRSNALIFNTTGTRYQSLLPMIRRLDTPPRQILVDAMIAEVLLTDEFALGVEFALEQGDVSLETAGRLGLPEGGGFISIVGSDGAVQASLSASNRLVNVLSNPSLVVRDGVSATISVGNDIPTVGATFFDPIESDTQVTSVQYRKTGVNLTVRPSLNAQGLVVMEIDQEISNTVEGGTEVAGNPAIFERSLSTEVVARSGETVLLGGLISENTNDTVAKVPGLGDLPFLGRLFRSESQTTERTELVVMITPRVLDESSKWDDILERLDDALRHLTLDTGVGNGGIRRE